MSKFRILHSDRDSELIIGNYTLEEANALKKVWTRFWGTFNQKHMLGQSPRHKAWATARLVPIDNALEMNDLALVYRMEGSRTANNIGRNKSKIYDNLCKKITLVKQMTSNGVSKRVNTANI